MADSSPKDTFDELKTLVTDYARQQTVDPLKRLGGWVAFGVAGALCLAIGGFLIMLGVLRLTQTFDFTEEGIGSSVPYLIVFVVMLAIMGLCFLAMNRTPDWLKDDE